MRNFRLAPCHRGEMARNTLASGWNRIVGAKISLVALSPEHISVQSPSLFTKRITNDSGIRSCCSLRFGSAVDFTLASLPPGIGSGVAVSVFVGSLSDAQRRATESLRRARDDLSETVQELKKTNEALGTSEAYLAEAQTLSHTGSFGWNAATGELFWSDESFRIFEYDRTQKPTVQLVLERVYPEDVQLVQEKWAVRLLSGR